MYREKGWVLHDQANSGIIWAFDRGHVHLEIAGFEPIIYDEVFFFM